MNDDVKYNCDTLDYFKMYLRLRKVVSFIKLGSTWTISATYEATNLFFATIT